MATGMSRPPLDRGLTSQSAFLGTNISGEEFEDLHEQREPVGKAPDFYDQNPLAASDEILETVVDDVKTPEAIRAIRNLLFWRQILGSIEPEWFKGIFQAIPEGIAEATAEREKPVGLFTLLRRLTNRDSLRGMAAAIDFLQAFGRHLQSGEKPLPRD